MDPAVEHLYKQPHDVWPHAAPPAQHPIDARRYHGANLLG